MRILDFLVRERKRRTVVGFSFNINQTEKDFCTAGLQLDWFGFSSFSRYYQIQSSYTGVILPLYIECSLNQMIIWSKIRFELKSSPHGATLDIEKGILKWKVVSNLILDDWTEVFVVRAVGGCGEQTFFEVHLDVMRCHCQNGGHCRTDMPIQDGSLVCQCPKGFTGLHLLNGPMQ